MWAQASRVAVCKHMKGQNTAWKLFSVATDHSWHPKKKQNSAENVGLQSTNQGQRQKKHPQQASSLAIFNNCSQVLHPRHPLAWPCSGCSSNSRSFPRCSSFRAQLAIFGASRSLQKPGPVAAFAARAPFIIRVPASCFLAGDKVSVRSSDTQTHTFTHFTYRFPHTFVLLHESALSSLFLASSGALPAICPHVLPRFAPRAVLAGLLLKSVQPRTKE